ncbi:hypothetical protein JKP88DRAFT_281382 [Tribonema minus]|uniref:Uncharacterized protein n=1 Tax=Tribonema minus TaxID=303371 RepID=A0A836C9H6_9STRA|nr:hypothetical protein JKP88DRAFT_281382 [Tribonema minus]
MMNQCALVKALSERLGSAQAFEELMARLQGAQTAEERDAQIVICTVHQTKGREWPRVQLGSDFGKFLATKDAPDRTADCTCTHRRATAVVTSSRSQLPHSPMLLGSPIAAAAAAASPRAPLPAANGSPMAVSASGGSGGGGGSMMTSRGLCGACMAATEAWAALPADAWQRSEPAVLGVQLANAVGVALTRTQLQLRLSKSYTEFKRWREAKLAQAAAGGDDGGGGGGGGSTAAAAASTEDAGAAAGAAAAAEGNNRCGGSGGAAGAAMGHANAPGVMVMDGGAAMAREHAPASAGTGSHDAIDIDDPDGGAAKALARARALPLGGGTAADALEVMDSD